MGAIVELNYGSPRAVKSRLGRLLGRTNHTLLLALAAVLLAVGVTLLVFSASLGWLIIGLAAWPLMIATWQAGELRKLPEVAGSDSIDSLLDSQILSLLPKQATPKDIANAVMQTQAGLFFAVRFGVTPNFLSQITSDDPSAAADIWKQATDVHEAMGHESLSAGMLVYAILKQFPDYEAVLAHNHLELADIKEGIIWQNRLNALISKHGRKPRTGGIGRDWSFGYTPLLSRFGQNISRQIAAGGLLNVELDSHQDSLNQLIDTFSSDARQNAVLVGPVGVGKTTIVHAFAEQLLDGSSKLSSNLKFRQVVMLDASSLISAAPGRGQLEDLIMRIFGEAYAAKNIILCLDDAQLFFEEGIGSVDLSNVLLPIIEAGRLRMILTMDEQRYLQISQRNSALVNALNRISVKPASKGDTILVMQDQLIMSEFKRKVTYTYQSLEESFRLSERYIYDLAMPGRALKLLESAAGYSEKGLVTINSVQQAIEQTMNIKIGAVSDGEERETLLNMEELIHKRMINQVRAVGVVSDALRRARAGVRNQNRPIGTFLFLGPTGVGKTELAKALAEVYFGGEDKIIRLDMNEFVRNEDVTRLIADGADDPNSLTAQAMKRPFSVILLDEIEKAHPNVLTTLLQLLDEGILRDIKNREVSFRDAIIIATSNAGADRIREYIERGYKLEDFENQFVDELISTNQFRPEFLNRFDEIVTFTPLGKEELLQVVDIMIADVNKTLALQKITVEVDMAAKRLLVEKGYDPRLGARPMRRVIQRVIENNVAKAILSKRVGAGSVIQINATDIEDNMNKTKRANAIKNESGYTAEDSTSR
ncbi:ATP-dependent Clp protease ATP-binding subunit [Candidatus Saccharibacteria bacterium]|nr:ATP-dependent Clp protease ATP-binding subunit [Candidatus Saccharibacteria bacterium]